MSSFPATYGLYIQTTIVYSHCGFLSAHLILPFQYPTVCLVVLTAIYRMGINVDLECPPFVSPSMLRLVILSLLLYFIALR